MTHTLPNAHFPFGRRLHSPVHISVEETWTQVTTSLWSEGVCCATIRSPDGMRMAVARFQDREIALAEPWTEEMGFGEARHVWTDGASTIAKRDRASSWRRVGWLDVGGKRYRVEPKHWLSLTFVLTHRSDRIGQITSDGLFSSTGTFTPTTETPIETVLFATELVRMLCTPRRGAAGAGGSGGGGGGC